MGGKRYFVVFFLGHRQYKNHELQNELLCTSDVRFCFPVRNYCYCWNSNESLFYRGRLFAEKIVMNKLACILLLMSGMENMILKVGRQDC